MYISVDDFIYQIYENIKGMSERGKLRNSGFGAFFHLQPTESSIGLIGSCFCWEDKAKIMEDIRPLFDGDEVFCFVVV